MSNPIEFTDELSETAIEDIEMGVDNNPNQAPTQPAAPPAKGQHKLANTFLCLSPDLEFNTLKAQILQKINEKLAPVIIKYEDYLIEWTIPCIQTSSMSSSSPADYKFLINHALKQKSPSTNLVIKAIQQPSKKRGEDSDSDENDSADGNGEDSNASDSDNECSKKKSKKQKKGKTFVETPLNKATNEKIQNLQNCWMCSKPGCSGDHCFIHPEHPEHFPLGHEHLLVWAAAWDKDPNLTDLDTPPNHHKFNTIPGQKNGTVSPLLSQCLAERNQPTLGLVQPGPVINFNILPEFLNAFRPATQVANIRRTTMDDAQPLVTQDLTLLIPPGAQHGAELTLNEFCAEYSLTDGVRAKLHKNGYTGTEMISFIIIPELKEMGFKHGEIAAMKVTIMHWCKYITLLSLFVLVSSHCAQAVPRHVALSIPSPVPSF
ncbi:hypothetical protein BDN67DRAFT_1010284 [Paxillus ammoniavirescens]|nr:hypothetical protein BDN67DRAFT_1010284 [Paxillus ammoniavirescens]